MGQPITAQKGPQSLFKTGDYAFGGIVFWVDDSGQHGLVCAKSDQARGILWNEKVGNSDDRLAEKVCSDYSVEVKGIVYDDWYLPSKEEVHRMFGNKKAIDKSAVKNGGSRFAENNELSPTEYCNNPAWDQEFNYAYKDYEYKNSKFNVRAVRTF